MAIRAWGRIISLIMHDKEGSALSVEAFMTKNIYHSTYLLDTSAHTRILESNLKQDIRHQEWFEAAAIKLGSSVQLFEKIRSHPQYKVRLELIETISLVLYNCFR